MVPQDKPLSLEIPPTMRILVVGAGDIGFQLSRRLSQDGYDTTMVEVDARRVKRVSDQLDVLLVEGSGTSYRVLLQADVEHAAIKRKQQTIIPHGKDVLVTGDQVFAVCQPSYTDRFIELTGQKDIHIDNIMILGGGLIGQFIAAELAGEARVKIIESSVRSPTPRG